jgi:hypothetical protein
MTTFNDNSHTFGVGNTFRVATYSAAKSTIATTNITTTTKSVC